MQTLLDRRLSGLKLGCAMLAVLLTAAPSQAAVEAKSLGDLLATRAALKASENPFPNRVEFPTHFERQVDTSQGIAITLVGSPEDLQRVLAEKSFANITDGVFAFTVSLDVEYDPERKLFSGESDPITQRNLEQAGFSNVRLNHTNPLEVAMLELTADGKDKNLFVLYVALADTGSVFRVTYQTPKGTRPTDFEIWRQFVRGLERRS
jgi:hypothetical protein